MDDWGLVARAQFQRQAATLAIYDGQCHPDDGAGRGREWARDNSDPQADLGGALIFKGLAMGHPYCCPVIRCIAPQT